MDPFDTLGLEPVYDLDRDALERRYRDLQRELHPDKHVASTAEMRRQSLSKAVDVNQAYRALKDDVKRGEALLARLGLPLDEAGESAQAGADPGFLMEMMELRETLAEARAAGDMQAVGVLGERARHEARVTRDQLRDALQAAQEGNKEALKAAAAILGRMRYFRRLQDEVAHIEEEALG